MIFLSEHDYEIKIPSKDIRENNSGNHSWQGSTQNLPLDFGNKFWVKAVRFGNQFQIANEALALFVGGLIDCRVLESGLIIKCNQEHSIYAYLSSKNLSPYIWLTKNQGETIIKEALRSKIDMLCISELGVRHLIFNTLLDNWDHITLVEMNNEITQIDFDKSFDGYDWTKNPVKSSKRTNWIAHFAIVGLPAYKQMEMYGQQIIADLISKISSIKKDFLQTARFLDISEDRVDFIIELLQARLVTLYVDILIAISTHPYYKNKI